MLGIIGLFLWISTGTFKVDQPKMEITKNEAIHIANKALKDYGFEPDSQWTMETRHNSWEGQNDRFVWQEHGKNTYYKLRGKYLGVPAWQIRYRKYSGEVAQRAEQISCYVNPTGEKTSIRHMLPETRDGGILNEEEARALVLDYVLNKYSIEVNMLDELEAKIQLIRQWVNSFLRTSSANYEEVYVDEVVAIILFSDDSVEKVKHISARETIQDLKGDHPTLKEGEFQFNYHEFIAALAAYNEEIVPAYQAFKKAKQEVTESLKEDLKS